MLFHLIKVVLAFYFVFRIQLRYKDSYFFQLEILKTGKSLEEYMLWVPDILMWDLPIDVQKHKQLWEWQGLPPQAAGT